MSVQAIADRAKRISIIGQLLLTFKDGTDRADLIARLRDGGAISEATADLLSEMYVETIA